MKNKRSPGEVLYRFNVALEMGLKRQIQEAAKREHRSLSNYVYVAIIEKMERDKVKT